MNIYPVYYDVNSLWLKFAMPIKMAESALMYEMRQ